MSLFDVPSNMTLLVDLLPFSSTITQGLLGVGILLMIFFGTFMITSGFGNKDGLVATSFITLVSALFLRYLGLINDFYLVITVIIFAIALVVVLSIRSPQA